MPSKYSHEIMDYKSALLINVFTATITIVKNNASTSELILVVFFFLHIFLLI
mgnify:FL=1